MNKPITLCDRCDIYMSCLLDYDGIPCRKNRTVNPINADRIRAMSDEELAKYLCKLIREGVMMAFPSAHYSSADIEELNQNWLDWLKQEVKR